MCWMCHIRCIDRTERKQQREHTFCSVFFYVIAPRLSGNCKRKFLLQLFGVWAVYYTLNIPEHCSYSIVRKRMHIHEITIRRSAGKTSAFSFYLTFIICGIVRWRKVCETMHSINLRCDLVFFGRIVFSFLPQCSPLCLWFQSYKW